MSHTSHHSPLTSLRVAILPLDITWADRDENLFAVERAMSQLPAGVDLVVLPELFSTGYCDDATMLNDLAETNQGPTLTAVRRWASQRNVAVAGSFMARVGSTFYNRAFFIEPSGDETFYDKHHLFSLSSEARTLGRGESMPPVVRFRGWNICLVVCYDLRFPVWCRNVRNAYDMLLVPANWPKARAYAWEHLLVARAIENQAVVIGANRSGRDDYGDYEGLSFIFDYMGKPVGQKEAGFIVANLKREEIDSYRSRFPVSADSDSFVINK